VASVPLQADWIRCEYRKPGGEIVLMPLYGSTPFVLPQLPLGVLGFMNQRLPDAVIWNYTAGMREGDFRRYPQLNRLVGLLAGLQLLPGIGQRINPTGATSSSADGLSVSRSGGYALKDMDERLKTEAEAIQNQIIDAWDGTLGFQVL
jgi:hypothetical protein